MVSPRGSSSSLIHLSTARTTLRALKVPCDVSMVTLKPSSSLPSLPSRLENAIYLASRLHLRSVKSGQKLHGGDRFAGMHNASISGVNCNHVLLEVELGLSFVHRFMVQQFVGQIVSIESLGPLSCRGDGVAPFVRHRHAWTIFGQ